MYTQRKNVADSERENGGLYRCYKETAGEGKWTHRGAYNIKDEASSLDTSRFHSLEEVNHTLCLESLQLRMETDECPCPPHSITGYGWVGMRKFSNRIIIM